MNTNQSRRTPFWSKIQKHQVFFHTSYKQTSARSSNATCACQQEAICCCCRCQQCWNVILVTFLCCLFERYVSVISNGGKFRELPGSGDLSPRSLLWLNSIWEGSMIITEVHWSCENEKMNLLNEKMNLLNAPLERRNAFSVELYSSQYEEEEEA